MNIVLIIYLSIRKFWINGHKSNMLEINEESNSNSILNVRTTFSQCCSFREFSLTQECILKHPGTVQIELIVGIIKCWRRAWQLTPVFLAGESHGQRSLAGYRELDMSVATEQAWSDCLTASPPQPCWVDMPWAPVNSHEKWVLQRLDYCPWSHQKYQSQN